MVDANLEHGRGHDGGLTTVRIAEALQCGCSGRFSAEADQGPNRLD
jgi:hypothetical protein